MGSRVREGAGGGAPGRDAGRHGDPPGRAAISAAKEESTDVPLAPPTAWARALRAWRAHLWRGRGLGLRGRWPGWVSARRRVPSALFDGIHIMIG